jgi:parallel beta-helix repeat protein
VEPDETFYLACPHPRMRHRRRPGHGHDPNDDVAPSPWGPNTPSRPRQRREPVHRGSALPADPARAYSVTAATPSWWPTAPTWASTSTTCTAPRRAHHHQGARHRGHGHVHHRPVRQPRHHLRHLLVVHRGRRPALLWRQPGRGARGPEPERGRAERRLRQQRHLGHLHRLRGRLLLENNECFGSVAEHGIYVSNSGDRPVLRRNRVHDNNASGIQLNADLSAGGDGIITGALIEANVIYNNGTGGGAAINLDGVQNSIVATTSCTEPQHRHRQLPGRRRGGAAGHEDPAQHGGHAVRTDAGPCYQQHHGRTSSATTSSTTAMRSAGRSPTAPGRRREHGQRLQRPRPREPGRRRHRPHPGPVEGQGHELHSFSASDTTSGSAPPRRLPPQGGSPPSTRGRP